MKLPFLPIILILLFTSCENETESSFLISKEGERKQLSISPKHLEGSNIGPVDQYGLIDDIYFFDNNLLMYDVKSDSIFLTYNLTDEIKMHFSKGEGPHQFVSPEFLKISNINDLASDVQIFQFGKGLYQLNLEHNQKNPLFILSEYGSIRGVQSVIMMGKGKFATVDIEPKTKLSIFDLNTKEPKNIPQNINDEIINSDQYYAAITPKDIGYNKNHEILFTWSGALNTIDLHDANGELIKSYVYGTNQNVEGNKFKRKYFYYYNLKSQGDYIYGLYAGFNMIDNFTQAVIPILKSQVHIFNIRTNETRIYHLDRLINTCAVDFKNNVIYGIEENNESQPLVKYEIN
jgi:hypothetical protein